MNTQFSKSISVLMLSLAVASCGGGGGDEVATSTPAPTPVSPTPPPPAPAPTQTLSTVHLPSSSTLGIDIYDPGNATRAVVFLHGGLGTNYGMANSLGLNSSTSAPTSATVNWAWLTANKIMAVFPQGANLTPTVTAPVAIPTWTNHVMNSGRDDVAFLQSLSSYLKTTYPSLGSNVYLAGHSNGGMMANRMWCESPTTFKAYVSMSGPASNFYATASNCAPGTVAPYFGIMGGADTVLNDVPWTGPTWTLTLGIANDNPAWVDRTVIAEIVQQQTRVTKMCGETLSAAVSIPGGTSSINTWTNCSGKVQLWDILTSDHMIDALQSASGKQMIDVVAGFVTAN